jgi:formamidopyrimidine-DNA glycosylase
MPELPEVETTRRGLIVSLEGTVITKVIKRRNKIRILIPDDFEKRI